VNNLLLDSQPLVVIPELATILGLNEAIILQQVHYWLVNNEKAGRNFEDGYYWTYGSYASWKEQFPFWSEKTIKNTILKLEKLGLLISGNFNKMALDKTKWYRIDYQKLDEIIKQNTLTTAQKGRPWGKIYPTMGQDLPNHGARFTQPLPETSTEIYTETSTKEKEISPDGDVGSLEPTDCSSSIKEIFEYYNEVFKDCWSKPLLLTPQRKKKISARLKNFTPEELKIAIQHIRASPFHCGNNDKGRIYATPDFIFRNDETVDKWLKEKPRYGGVQGYDPPQVIEEW